MVRGPALQSAQMTSETSLVVSFDRPANISSAEFAIDGGATVLGSQLAENGMSVSLTVSGISEHDNVLTVRGIVGLDGRSFRGANTITFSGIPSVDGLPWDENFALEAGLTADVGATAWSTDPSGGGIFAVDAGSFLQGLSSESTWRSESIALGGESVDIGSA